MSFPAGRAILVVLIVACASGAVILATTRNPPRDAGPAVWVFAESHARFVRRAAGDRPVDVKLIAARAADVRLRSMNASGNAANVPALVEIEIGSVGKYFRGHAADVPFVPLTGRLRKSGWLERLSPARVAVWSTDGEVFGVPLDVHPVSLTYRKDLFDAANVNLADVRTWPELHDRFLAYERHARPAGGQSRAALLPSASADVVAIMLQQRGVDLVTPAGDNRLTDPRVAATLSFYARMVAGPDRVSSDASPGPGRWAHDLANGHAAAAVTPDWAVDDLRAVAPQLVGKLAMRPLPIFDPADAPTASWGGTMVAIPRSHPDPDAAWTLLERLYLSDAARAARAADPAVLPAVETWWADAANAPPDALFVGEQPAAVYASLARRVPPRAVTPLTATATSALSVVLYRATASLESGGGATLDADVARWLCDASLDLQSRARFATLGR